MWVISKIWSTLWHGRNRRGLASKKQAEMYEWKRQELKRGWAFIVGNCAVGPGHAGHCEPGHEILKQNSTIGRSIDIAEFTLYGSGVGTWRYESGGSDI